MKYELKGNTEFPAAHAGDRYYALSYPASLIFQTVHPGSSDAALTSWHLYPDGIMNSVLSHKEAESFLAGRGLHQHDYFELLYVVRGEMVQNIEHRRHLYRQGSLCLLNRSVEHAEEFTTDYETLFLGISAPLMEDILRMAEHPLFPSDKALLSTALTDFFARDDGSKGIREYMDFIPRENDTGKNNDREDAAEVTGHIPLSSHAFPVFSILEKITRLFMNTPCGSSFLLLGYLQQLFLALMDERFYEVTPVLPGTSEEIKIFDDIDAILHRRHGRITRAELSAELSYSGDYIGRIVRRQTGLAFFDYSMTICMAYAAKLLCKTDLPVTEIAQKLNFSNRKHFYDLFEKHFGMTPAKYRSAHKENSTEDDDG